MANDRNDFALEDSNGRKHITTEPLLHPPQRTWVGLTDEEAQETFARHNCTISADLAGILARAIGAKLKKKNN